VRESDVMVDESEPTAGPLTLRLLEAMNGHDLEALVGCFDVDYESSQPAHPDRHFRGAEQVRQNWSGVFDGVRNFRAEILCGSALSRDREIAEWRWFGSHRDGEAFDMCGVTVLGTRDGRIAWGRLYMEPVTRDGINIDEMVQDTYRPSGTTEGVGGGPPPD
jgi:ketosteroid isomerase-like protein